MTPSSQSIPPNYDSSQKPQRSDRAAAVIFAPMTYHERYMRRALDEAERALRDGEVPVGAIVVRGEEVIGVGCNRTIARNDPTAHAEIIAIRMAGEMIGSARLDGCSLYVTLEPCPMCAGAIVNARLGRLFFGAYDAKAGATGTLYAITTDGRLNHRVETHGGVLDVECAAILQSFFQERRGSIARGGVSHDE